MLSRTTGLGSGFHRWRGLGVAQGDAPTARAYYCSDGQACLVEHNQGPAPLHPPASGDPTLSRRKPSYPLHAVLRQREIEREREQVALANASRDVQQARADLTAALFRRQVAETRCSKARARLAELAQGPVPGSVFAYHWDFQQACERAMAEAESAVQCIQTRLHHAQVRQRRTQAALLEANRRLKLQEKHHEDWLDRQRLQQRRNDEKQETEMARLLHQRRHPP